ncbi:MAG: AsmA-like C-terminal region-containing protein [Bacteroidota bacterium]
MKYLKKTLAWMGIFIAAMMLILVVVAAFFEDQISDRLVKEINKQLRTELKVGEFNLSLLSGFPKASANLHDVELEDAMQGTLLESQNLSFRFGLLSLFGSNIKVHSVLIEDGSLYIKKDKRGRLNYDIVKGNSEKQKANEGEENEFALSIDEAQLNRVEVIYVDQVAKHYTKFHVNKAVVSGEFAADQFSLYSFADLKSHFFQSNGEKYFVDENVIYDAKIAVDFANQKYDFEDVSVALSTNTFNVDGTIENVKKGTEWDLNIDGKEGSLASVFALLPPKQKEYFKDFDSKGNFYFKSAIRGLQTKYSDPAVSVEFGLEHGRVSSEKLGGGVKDVSFTANFTNGKQRNNRNSSFEIKDFKGYFDRELFEGKLRISNLDNPLIDLKLDGVLPMESIYGLFESPIITDGDGEIELKQIRLKGRYKDIVSPYGIGRVDTAGEIEFDDAELTVNRKTILVDKGLFTFRDNSLKVEDFVFEGPGTEIELDGTFLNLLPVLFADSLNSKKAELKFSAALDAPKIDLDQLIALTAIPVNKNDVGEKVMDSLKVEKIHERERITNFLKGKFEARIDEFNYEKVEAEDFRGTLEFDNNEMLVAGKVKTMEGRMLLDGTAYFEDRPKLEAKLTCERMNIKEFFRQVENFGQKVLVDKNLKGKLDAKLFIKAFWDEEGSFLMDKMHVLADVGITNGELVGMKMLYDFSDYIKIRDLQRIKFTELHNYMEVKKGKIYLPAMFIQSNAMNMTMSGTHTFENKIDYHVKVNAGQVVWNKFKKHNPTYKPQKAKKSGWFNLYYRIYGPMETFTYESDKKRVKRSFDLSETRKRRIQKELRKHFGDIVSIEEPVDWKDVIPEFDDGGDGDDDDVEFIDFDTNEEDDRR